MSLACTTEILLHSRKKGSVRVGGTSGIGTLRLRLRMTAQKVGVGSRHSIETQTTSGRDDEWSAMGR
jgi:hypothetical protein